MTEYLIRLPWPPAKSSPNGSQGDYLGKARAGKSYKQECAWECKRQGVRKMACDRVSVEITYYPPTGHRIDWDNMAVRAKRGWDAVAEAIGVDDSKWWPVTCDKGDKTPGGCVLVHIKPVG